MVPAESFTVPQPPAPICGRPVVKDSCGLAVQQLFEYPAEARYLVDVGCVFDVYLSGRRTLLALDIPEYYSAKGEPFDYLIVTRTGIEQHLPQALGARQRIRTIGNPDDPLAVFIEVWTR